MHFVELRHRRLTEGLTTFFWSALDTFQCGPALSSLGIPYIKMLPHLLLQLFRFQQLNCYQLKEKEQHFVKLVQSVSWLASSSVQWSPEPCKKKLTFSRCHPETWNASRRWSIYAPPSTSSQRWPSVKLKCSYSSSLC